MGKIPQGILGGVSGKVGGVVGSSWKGISVVKTKPLSVANPRTAGQIAQRNAFSLIVQDATALLSSVVKPLWDRSAVKMSGFNSFIKANIDNMGVSGPVDPLKFVISKGKMLPPSLMSASVDVNSKVCTVEWTRNDSDPFALPSDEVYAVIRKFKEGNELAEGVKCTNNAGVGEDSFSVSPEFVTDDTAFVYIAFRRIDGTIVSNSLGVPLSLIP